MMSEDGCGVRGNVGVGVVWVVSLSARVIA
jgi:hypothetical protein